MTVLIQYINLSNLSWMKKCLFLRKMEPLTAFQVSIVQETVPTCCIFCMKILNLCKMQFLHFIKVNGYIFREGNSVKMFCVPSEKESTLNSFLLE